MTGIHFALDGNIKYAVVCLMISGVCDMFDGPVARHAKRTDREKSFGIQIDSLADVIAFGVFPAVIGYAVSAGHFGAAVSLVIISLYVLAALIRLGYFTIIEMELQSRSEKRKYYEGLPVTSVALIIPMIYSICLYFDISFSVTYNVVLVVLAIAFVSKVKIPKIRGRYLIIFCVIGLPFIIYILLAGGIQI